MPDDFPGISVEIQREHSVEFGLLSYREMGGDLWLVYVNLLRPINSDFKMEKKQAAVSFLSTSKNGVTFRLVLLVSEAEAGLPWRLGSEKILGG